MASSNAYSRIALIHGPNLNLLGKREISIYGTKTLEQINLELKNRCQENMTQLDILQTNHEGEIIDFLQNNYVKLDGLIINPAGLGHTSIALRDTLLAVELPFIEVHLTNIHAREDFRRQTLLQDLAMAVISGCGAKGYHFAFEAMFSHLHLHNVNQKTSLSTEI
tara:strand:- start:112 stop:606 length:495 start_codon:yes stop_codon:yes gene_type:complete